MQSKNAIGNLINRYKAVLKKCYLLNTFGCLLSSCVLAGTLTFGACAMPTDAMAATNITIDGNEVINNTTLSNDGNITTSPTITPGSYTLTINGDVTTTGSVTIGNGAQTGNLNISLQAGTGNTFTHDYLTIQAGNTTDSVSTSLSIESGVTYTVNENIDLIRATNDGDTSTLNVNSSATLNAYIIDGTSSSQHMAEFNLEGDLRKASGKTELALLGLKTTLRDGAEIFTDNLTLNGGTMDVGNNTFTVDGVNGGTDANTFKTLTIEAMQDDNGLDADINVSGTTTNVGTLEVLASTIHGDVTLNGTDAAGAVLDVAGRSQIENLNVTQGTVNIEEYSGSVQFAVTESFTDSAAAVINMNASDKFESAALNTAAGFEAKGQYNINGGTLSFNNLTIDLANIQDQTATSAAGVIKVHDTNAALHIDNATFTDQNSTLGVDNLSVGSITVGDGTGTLALDGHTLELGRHSQDNLGGTINGTLDADSAGSVIEVRGENWKYKDIDTALGANGALFIVGGTIEELSDSAITRAADDFQEFDDSGAGAPTPLNAGISFSKTSGGSAYSTEELILEDNKDQTLNIGIGTLDVGKLTVENTAGDNNLTVSGGTLQVRESVTADTITITTVVGQGALNDSGFMKFAGENDGTKGAINTDLVANGMDAGGGLISTADILVESGDWTANGDITLDHGKLQIGDLGAESAHLNLGTNTLTVTSNDQVIVGAGSTLTLAMSNLGSFTGTKDVTTGWINENATSNTIASNTFRVSGEVIFTQSTVNNMTFLEYTEAITELKGIINDPSITSQGIYSIGGITLSDVSGATVDNTQNIGGLEGKEIGIGSGNINAGNTLKAGWIENTGGGSNDLNMAENTTLTLDSQKTDTSQVLTPGDIIGKGDGSTYIDTMNISLSNGTAQNITLTDSKANVTLKNMLLNGGISITDDDSTTSSGGENPTSTIILDGTTVTQKVIQDGSFDSSPESGYSTLISRGTNEINKDGANTDDAVRTEYFVAEANSSITITGNVNISNLGDLMRTPNNEEGTAIMYNNSKVDIGGDYNIEKSLTLGSASNRGTMELTVGGTLKTPLVIGFEEENIKVDVGAYDNSAQSLKTTGQNSDFTFDTLQNTDDLIVGAGGTFTVRSDGSGGLDPLTGKGTNDSVKLDSLTLNASADFTAGSAAGTGNSDLTIDTLSMSAGNSTTTGGVTTIDATTLIGKNIKITDLNIGTAVNGTTITGENVEVNEVDAGTNTTIKATGTFKTTTGGVSVGANSNITVTGAYSTATGQNTSLGDDNKFSANSVDTGAFTLGARSDATVTTTFEATGTVTLITGTSSAAGDMTTLTAGSFNAFSLLAGDYAKINIAGDYSTGTNSTSLGKNSIFSIDGNVTTGTFSMDDQNNPVTSATVNVTGDFNASGAVGFGTNNVVDIEGTFQNTTSGSVSFGNNNNVDINGDLINRGGGVSFGEGSKVNITGNIDTSKTDGTRFSLTLKKNSTLTVGKNITAGVFDVGDASTVDVTDIDATKLYINEQGKVEAVNVTVTGVIDMLKGATNDTTLKATNVTAGSLDARNYIYIDVTGDFTTTGTGGFKVGSDSHVEIDGLLDTTNNGTATGAIALNPGGTSDKSPFDFNAGSVKTTSFNAGGYGTITVTDTFNATDAVSIGSATDVKVTNSFTAGGAVTLSAGISTNATELNTGSFEADSFNAGDNSTITITQNTIGTTTTTTTGNFTTTEAAGVTVGNNSIMRIAGAYSTKNAAAGTSGDTDLGDNNTFSAASVDTGAFEIGANGTATVTNTFNATGAVSIGQSTDVTVGTAFTAGGAVTLTGGTSTGTGSTAVTDYSVLTAGEVTAASLNTGVYSYIRTNTTGRDTGNFTTTEAAGVTVGNNSIMRIAGAYSTKNAAAGTSGDTSLGNDNSFRAASVDTGAFSIGNQSATPDPNDPTVFVNGAFTTTGDATFGNNNVIGITGDYETDAGNTSLGNNNIFNVSSVNTGDFIIGEKGNVSVGTTFNADGAVEIGSGTYVTVNTTFEATGAVTLSAGTSGTSTDYSGLLVGSFEADSLNAGEYSNIKTTSGNFTTTGGGVDVGNNSLMSIGGNYATGTAGTVLGADNVFSVAGDVTTAGFSIGEQTSARTTLSVDVNGNFTTTGDATFGNNNIIDFDGVFNVGGIAEFGDNNQVSIGTILTPSQNHMASDGFNSGSGSTINIAGNFTFGDGVRQSNILGTVNVSGDLNVNDHFNLGSNTAAGQGIMTVTGTASFKDISGLMDPVWDASGTYLPSAASQLAVASLAPGGLDGTIAVGQNSHFSIGTGIPTTLSNILADSGNYITPDWGMTGITAAVGLFGGSTHNIAANGALIVDGRLNNMVVSGGTTTFSGTGGASYSDISNGDAIFAANSLLVIDNAAAFDSTANFALTGAGELQVADGARLHVIGAIPNQEIYVANFASGNETTIVGWNTTDKEVSGTVTVSTNTALLDVTTARGAINEHGDNAGTYVLTFGQTPAANIFPCLDPSMQKLVDAMVAKYGAPVTYANPGIELVSKVVSDTHGYGVARAGEAAMILESAAQPAALTGVARTTMDVSKVRTDAITARTSQAKLGDNGKEMGQMHLAENGTITAGENIPEMEKGLGLWVAPQFDNLNTFGNMCNNCYDNGYSTDFGGITAGADYTFSDDFKAGVAVSLGGGQTITKGEMLKTTNSFYYWGISAYGSYHMDNFTLMADVGYSQTINEISQTLPGSLLMGSNSADLNAHVFNVGLTAEYVFETEYLDIIPHAGVRFMSVYTDGYDVENGGTAFEVEADQQNVWYFPVGITFQNDIAITDEWTFTPRLDLGFVAAAGDLHVNSRARIPGVNYQTDLELQNVDGFAFKGGLGFDISGENLKFTLTYNIQASEHETGHGLFGALSYEF